MLFFYPCLRSFEASTHGVYIDPGCEHTAGPEGRDNVRVCVFVCLFERLRCLVGVGLGGRWDGGPGGTLQELQSV